MAIRKVKVTLLLPEPDAGVLPYPHATMITDEAGNEIVCRFPIDIHIDEKGCYVTLRMDAEVEIEGQHIAPEKL